jgi:hypothetical protein
MTIRALSISSFGPGALSYGPHIPQPMRMQPHLERARHRNGTAMMAKPTSDGILKNQEAAKIEAMKSRKANTRSSAFSAVR